MGKMFIGNSFSAGDIFWFNNPLKKENTHDMETSLTCGSRPCLILSSTNNKYKYVLGTSTSRPLGQVSLKTSLEEGSKENYNFIPDTYSFVVKEGLTRLGSYLGQVEPETFKKILSAIDTFNSDINHPSYVFTGRKIRVPAGKIIYQQDVYYLAVFDSLDDTVLAIPLVTTPSEYELQGINGGIFYINTTGFLNLSIGTSSSVTGSIESENLKKIQYDLLRGKLTSSANVKKETVIEQVPSHQDEIISRLDNLEKKIDILFSKRPRIVIQSLGVDIESDAITEEKITPKVEEKPKLLVEKTESKPVIPSTPSELRPIISNISGKEYLDRIAETHRSGEVILSKRMLEANPKPLTHTLGEERYEVFPFGEWYKPKGKKNSPCFSVTDEKMVKTILSESSGEYERRTGKNRTNYYLLRKQVADSIDLDKAPLVIKALLKTSTVKAYKRKHK